MATVQEAAGVVQAQATKLYDDGKQVVTDQVHKLQKNGKADDAVDREDWDTTARPGQLPANSF